MQGGEDVVILIILIVLSIATKVSSLFFFELGEKYLKPVHLLMPKKKKDFQGFSNLSAYSAKRKYSCILM